MSEQQPICPICGRVGVWVNVVEGDGTPIGSRVLCLDGEHGGNPDMALYPLPEAHGQGTGGKEAVTIALQTIDTPVLMPCPSCSGTLVKRTVGAPGVMLCPPPSATVLCRDCGTLLPEPTRTDRRVRTQERMHRAGAPLRSIAHIDRGRDGEGMVFHLECGHVLRLQRRDYRFSQKRARCVACRMEGRS